jgi:hypothetical protein
MKNCSRFGLAASFLLASIAFSPAIARAQWSARIGGVRISGRPMAPRASNVRVTGTPNGFAGTPLFGFGSSFGGNNNLSGIEAAIDPATQWRLFERQRFGRNRGFFGGGLWGWGGADYIVPSDYYDTDQAPQSVAAAPVVIVQQAPDAHPPVADGPADTAAVQPPTLPDAGPFTLVLRSGNKIEAVAFTRQDDSIVYISPDGSRRTLARSDLDSDSTVRVNEERGTPLQSSL